MTPEEAAAAFAGMAEKVRMNADNGFSGAVVVVPPVHANVSQAAKTIEWLLVGGDQDPALFWSTLKTQIDIRLKELSEAEQRSSAGWGFNAR